MAPASSAASKIAEVRAHPEMIMFLISFSFREAAGFRSAKESFQVCVPYALPGATVRLKK